MRMAATSKTSGWFFFKFFFCFVEKSPVTDYGFGSSFEKINRFPSLDFLGVFCVREKAFYFTLSTFSPPKRKKHP